jgi:hypothetical protein
LKPGGVWTGCLRWVASIQLPRLRNAPVSEAPLNARDKSELMDTG